MLDGNILGSEKGINDTYGHLAGDEVLGELCRRIRGMLRRDEVLARYGGEEFALAMSDTSWTHRHFSFGEFSPAQAFTPGSSAPTRRSP